MRVPQKSVATVSLNADGAAGSGNAAPGRKHEEEKKDHAGGEPKHMLFHRCLLLFVFTWLGAGPEGH